MSRSVPSDLPMVLPLTDSMSVSDLLRALAIERFADGTQPFCREIELKALPTDADLAPFGGQIERQLLDVDREVLVRGDGWTMLVQRWSSGRGRVTVVAVDEHLADDVAQAIAKQDVHPATGPDGVDLGFWNLASRGPRRRIRAVPAPAWSSIRRNYATSVAEAADRLMECDGVPVSGRLVLFHGPPGTGKTTLIRALARAWAPWCRTEVVIDPEQLFDNSSYLGSVLLEEDNQLDFPADEEGETRPGRLLVLEDCDELIRSKGKEKTGQALSRLLNLTDGLIGDGLGALVCLTTNERLDLLHPAVVRPGRCLANIEVPALPRPQAASWLGCPEHAIPAAGATLAELFQRSGDIAKIEQTKAKDPGGLYL